MSKTVSSTNPDDDADGVCDRDCVCVGEPDFVTLGLTVGLAVCVSLLLSVCDGAGVDSVLGDLEPVTLALCDPDAVIDWLGVEDVLALADPDGVKDWVWLSVVCPAALKKRIAVMKKPLAHRTRGRGNTSAIEGEAWRS